MIDRRSFLKYLSVSPLLAGCGRDDSMQSKAVRAEVVIVGSGPAGLSIADRLSAAGMDVLVVDSGIRQLDFERQSLARVESANETHSRLFSMAGRRAVGGTSHVWGGICPRFRPSDLVCQSRYGYGMDWPLSYRELEHYYCAAEHWLGVAATSRQQQRGGECADLALSPYLHSAGVLKWEMKNRGYRKVGPAAMSVDSYGWYAPVNLLEEKIPVLLRRRHFRLMSDCTVRRVHVDGRGVARSLTATSFADGVEVSIRAGLVILCAGAIQNPRLLLLSKSPAFPDGPGNGAGHVGRWFMDHPNYQIWLQPRRRWLSGRYRAGVLHVHHWYEHFRKTGLGAMLARIGAFAQVPFDGRSVAPPGYTLMLEATTEQEPLYSNAVSLHGGKVDRFGDPLPLLSFEHSERDRATIASSISALEPLRDHFGNHYRVRPQRITSHHLMGTTRMSGRADDGVVDADLRVHGTRNLYVAGSSVFPTGAAANPTLTLTALSLRLADRVLALQERGELKNV